MSEHAPMSRSLLSFGFVGVAAAVVHYVVVLVTVPSGVHPLAANVIGFLTAFGVSYRGHRRWTFPGSGGNRSRTLPRFFAIALTGFAANELLYGIVLQSTALDYRIALVPILGLIAASTFLAARFWAFSIEH